MKIKHIIIITIIIVAFSIFFIMIYGNMSAYYIGYPRISENDKFCDTFWIVHHDTPLDYWELENYIRKEISKFGSQYDVPWRDITIKQIDDDTTSITIKGTWSSPEPDEPNLQEKISQFEQITKMEKTRGVCA